MVALAQDLSAMTWRALEAGGARITLTSTGLTAPRVDVVAPKPVASDLRAALDWRRSAMQQRLGRALDPSRLPTLVAADGPFGRAQCGSCGEPWGEGDCPLCMAARVAVLRAAGLLPAAAPRAAEPLQTMESWRHALYTGAPRTLALDVAPVPTWSCAKCKREVTGQRDADDECGPCELKRISVMDPSRLYGGGG